jgi:ribosomal protein S18 acetylase RimI-like enzyme
MIRKPRWEKMKPRDMPAVEALLREREYWCVNACARFLKRDPARDHVWGLRNTAGGVSALVVQSKRGLLPVFCGIRNIPLPRLLCGFFKSIKVHSVQGVLEETALLQNALERAGLRPAENLDFDLMALDGQPSAAALGSVPAALIIRKPQDADLNALAALQAAYEQEEVLPYGGTFNPAVSRANTERIFNKAHVFVAQIGGRLVGKINTNAVAFSRFQLGGVYVHPGYRGLGIGRRMAFEFVRFLISQDKGVSLFVKKENAAASAIYRKLGFEITGDYRIGYY